MDFSKPWVVLWVIKPNTLRSKEFDDPFMAREWMNANVRGGHLYHQVE